MRFASEIDFQSTETGTGALGDWYVKVLVRTRLKKIFKCRVHMPTRAAGRKNEMMVETRSQRALKARPKSLAIWYLRA